jgi:hypothetical protein
MVPIILRTANSVIAEKGLIAGNKHPIATAIAVTTTFVLYVYRFFVGVDGYVTYHVRQVDMQIGNM